MVASACGTVHVRDGEWCGDKGERGATCFYTLSDRTRKLSKKEWDLERFGKVCTGSENFANWKTAIEQLCYQTKSCTYEDEQRIEAFFQRVEGYVVSLSEPVEDGSARGD